MNARCATSTAPVVHLHTHSFFSFLDGASSPEALARRAAALGQEALALTDWNGLYGAVPFDRACRAAGVRPIHGAEVALADGRHLTLLVADQEGWRSLCRLLTRAQLEGAKGRAPVRPALLAEHAAGLLCLSGCHHGALAGPLLAGDETAWATARRLRDLFGARLWVELPRHLLPDDRPLTGRLAALADRLGVGVVASANVHYAIPEEGAAGRRARLRPRGDDPGGHPPPAPQPPPPPRLERGDGRPLRRLYGVLSSCPPLCLYIDPLPSNPLKPPWQEGGCVLQ